MKIYKYSVGAMGTNSYIVCDEASGEAFMTDPGDDGEKLVNAVRSTWPEAIVSPIMGLNYVMENTDAKLLVHPLDAPMLKEPSLSLLSRFSAKNIDFPSPDGFVNDGDSVRIGDSEVTVIHTPGHTPGSICLLAGDDLISGDTLFRESIGRYDFPGGSFDTIMKSLKKIVSLNVKGKIYPGHGMSTTMSHELEYNTYLM